MYGNPHIPSGIQEFSSAMTWGITLFTTQSTKSIIWRSACDGWRSAILKYVMLDCHAVCLSHHSSFVYCTVGWFPGSYTFASSSDSSLSSQSNVDAINQLLASLCNSSPNQFAHAISMSEGKWILEALRDLVVHPKLVSMAFFTPFLVGALEHFLFSHSVGNVIIPIDKLIFFRGVQTTNQHL